MGCALAQGGNGAHEELGYTRESLLRKRSSDDHGGGDGGGACERDHARVQKYVR